MKRNAFAALMAALLLSGCAVTVVTVHVVESDVGYADNATSTQVVESNLK